MTGDVARLAACNVLFLAAGAGVTRLLGAWRTPAGFLRTVGVAYLAGVAAFGVTMQFLLVLGAPFERWLVIVVCLVLAASGIAALRPVDPPALAVSVPRYLLPSAALLVGIVALMAVDLWYQPLGVFDAWAQWTAKARALLDFKGLDADVLASSPYRPWNPDYPVLVPAVEAADFSFMRKVDTLAVHLQFWLVYAGFLLALLELLRGRVREALVWPFVLTIALAPAVQIQTAASLADVPVAVFFALAGLYAWRWLVDEDMIALRLFALFAAGAYASKFEGRIYVGSLSLVLLVLLARSGRRRVTATLAAAVVALVGIVPWSLWVSQHHVVGIFSTSLRGRLGEGLIDKVGRIPTIAVALAENTLNPSRWLLLGVVLLAGLAVPWLRLRGRREPWLLAGTVGLVFVGLVLVYWATPLELHFHLARSARRVVTGPLLFTAALLPLLLESSLRAPRRLPEGNQ